MKLKQDFLVKNYSFIKMTVYKEEHIKYTVPAIKNWFNGIE